MKTISEPRAKDSHDSENRSLEDKLENRAKPRRRSISRRLFLGRSFAAGAGTIGVGLLGNSPGIEPDRPGLTPGDAALLRFPAPADFFQNSAPPHQEFRPVFRPIRN